MRRLGIIFVFSILGLYFPSYAVEKTPRRVLVSVVPYKYFVQKIAGDAVEVFALVPAGMSPHVYEPTARRVMMMASADLWFTIGGPFEKRALIALSGHYPNLQVVDLRKGIDLLHGGEHCHADAECNADLHVWLSLRLAKIQATTIAEALSGRYPELSSFFSANLKKFHQELDLLDEEITSLFASSKRRYLVISHPAYGYFCRDYGLIQIGIEREGIVPSPWELDQLLKQIEGLSIKHLFAVHQHSDKAVRLIAEKIGAKVVVLDPLAEDYLNNLRETAESINKL